MSSKKSDSNEYTEMISNAYKSSVEAVKKGAKNTTEYIKNTYNNLTETKDKPLKDVGHSKEEPKTKVIDYNIDTDIYKNENLNTSANTKTNNYKFPNQKDNLTNIKRELNNKTYNEQSSTISNIGDNINNTKEFAKKNL